MKRWRVGGTAFGSVTDGSLRLLCSILNGNFKVMRSDSAMSHLARATTAKRKRDRGLPDLAEAVRLVTTAMVQAELLNASGLSPDGWAGAFAALDALRNAYVEGGQDGPKAAQQLRGIRDLPKASIVAVVAIDGDDLCDGLSNQLSGPVGKQVDQAVRYRIGESLVDVTIGRTSPTRIELCFSGDAREAHERLVNLHRLLESPIAVTGEALTLDVTIGFSSRCSDAENNIGLLVEQAEHALAKARHSNAKVVGYSEVDRRRRAERIALMRDLREAIPNGELFVCYQPKMDLRTLSVSGVEALVRWRHPIRGLVPPDEFIAFAEEGPQIRSLTQFVITEALARRAELRKAGRGVTIAVNISANLLADEAFAAWTANALNGDGVGIGFEITETAVIANPERALANIRSFTDAGVTISIDDYGSGLSSLIYLKQIPAHELKIDKAFVTDLTSSHRGPLLVRSTIDLGHALGMKVTAEGVDNARSFALLQVMGCDMIQGYHISKPLLYDQLTEFLQTFDAEIYDNVPLFRASK